MYIIPVEHDHIAVQPLEAGLTAAIQFTVLNDNPRAILSRDDGGSRAAAGPAHGRIIHLSLCSLDETRTRGYYRAMDPLARFHPLVREWFLSRFPSPTDIQKRAWEAIAAGRHTLITAPTGSGKTLAAFLWFINVLITSAGSVPPRSDTPGPAGKHNSGFDRKTTPDRVRLLYVSPLKALNNDIHKNLIRPLEELQTLFREHGHPCPAIRVMTRSGDTSESERRLLRRRPPEILITTPESLNILLTSPHGAHLFGALSAVILDEIHAVLESKRGTHLIAAVERLTRYAGEFQRVSLSATVKPLSAVAEFIGGRRLAADVPAAGAAETAYLARPVSIVEDKAVKRYDISVNAPFLTNDPATGDGGWGPLVGLCRDIIDKNRSTLFFASSRKKTEKLSRLINEAGPEILAYSHHGALAREIRLSVEDQLKAGRLKAIVATGTLELGIDIGELDEVVLLQSSASVHQAVQRIGRAGHQVSGTSKGTLVPLGGADLVHLGALARAVKEHDIEAVMPLEAPLDVLAQIILSMACVEQWKLDDLYRFLRTIHPYRGLERAHFDQVVSLLAGRYQETNIRELKPRILLDQAVGTISAVKGARFLLNTAGGTIPDRGYYELRHAETGSRLGDLDEEFVWERNVGDTFVFGPSTWRIRRITHNAVEVEAQSDEMAMAPFYRAEEQNRSFHFSNLIGRFLETAQELLADEKAWTGRLAEEYHFTPEAVAALRRLLISQMEHTGTDLPHRHHLVIEHCQVPQAEGQIGIIILHTFWGGRVNKPLADAFALLWEDRFHYPLEHFTSNDCIIFHAPHEFSSELFREILSSPDLVPALLRQITRSNAFGALFRENAGRALLLPRARPHRRMPFWLTRLKSKNLLAAILRFPDFPLLTETASNLVTGVFDLASLRRIVEEIQSGVIRISEATTSHPSPLAGEIVWRMTNQFMYENDQLQAREINPWRTEEQLLFDPRLLQAVPPLLIHELERKLQRLHPGYTPRDADDLFILVKERLAVPAPEWTALEKAVNADGETDFTQLIKPRQEKFVSILVPRARTRLTVLRESLPFLCRALAIAPDALQAWALDGTPLAGAGSKPNSRRPAQPATGREEDSSPSAAGLLETFLRFYGPISEEALRDLWGWDEEPLRQTLNDLLEEEKIVYGRLIEGDTRFCLCDRENYGRLLYMRRHARRTRAPLLELASLPLWLATRQHLLDQAAGPEALPRALDGMLGWPAAAAAWEEYLLPARVPGYTTEFLDSLLVRTDLMWLGAGQNKIIFTFPDDLALYQSGTGHAPSDAAAFFPQGRGRYSLEDLIALTGMTPAALQERLWRGVWQSSVANTTFDALRQALALKFAFARETERGSRRRKPNLHSRWSSRLAAAGFWHLIEGGEAPVDGTSESVEATLDPIQALEMDKDRVRCLLDRYGCLFRELLVHESPAFQWKRLFPALRVMELSGEIMGGQFFKQVPGIQFFTEEVLTEAGSLDTEKPVFWMNAQDPASPCGKPLSALKGLYPERLSSTWLVFQGQQLVLIVKKNGGALQFLVEPDDPRLAEYGGIFTFLTGRAVNPLPSVKVKTINGQEALQSPYRSALHTMGFEEAYQSLVLRRKI